MMKWASCVVVVILIFPHVNGDTTLSLSVQEIQDLDEYAQEVSRLFEDLDKPVTAYDKSGPIQVVWKDPSWQDNAYGAMRSRSGSREDIPAPMSGALDEGRFSHAGSYSELVQSREPPFIIDEKNNSSAENKSRECLSDRHRMKTIFQGCIFLQSFSPEQNVNVSESKRPDYDSHFLKYCRKAKQLRTCIKESILSKMEDCLDEGVRESINNIEDMTVHMIKYICIKEADRISSFIEDGGLNCLKSNSGSMLRCLSSNLAGYFVESVYDLPSLKVTEDKCDKLSLAESCVDEQLKSCHDQSAAMVVGLLFVIVQEVASCGGNSSVTEVYLPPVNEATNEKYEIIGGAPNEDEPRGDSKSQEDMSSRTGGAPNEDDEPRGDSKSQEDKSPRTGGAPNEDDDPRGDSKSQEDKSSRTGGAPNEDDEPRGDSKSQEDKSSRTGGAPNEHDEPRGDSKSQEDKSSGTGGAPNEDDEPREDSKSQEDKSSRTGGAPNEDDEPRGDSKSQEDKSSRTGGAPNEDDEPRGDSKSQEDKSSGTGGAPNEDDEPRGDSKSQEDKSPRTGGARRKVYQPAVNNTTREDTSGGSGTVQDNPQRSSLAIPSNETVPPTVGDSTTNYAAAGVVVGLILALLICFVLTIVPFNSK